MEAPSAAAGLDRYLARPAADLQTLEVDYCPGGEVPRLLQPGQARYRELLQSARALPDGEPLKTSTRGLRPGALGAGGCLRYTVRLPARGDGRWRMQEGRVGEAVLAPPDLWLWRPPGAKAPIELRLELPPGLEASLPWPRSPDGSYRISPTTWRYLSRAAFGRLRSVELPAAGGLLRVAHLGEPFAGGDPLLHRALVRAAEAVAAPLGRLPAAQIQVLLLGVPGDSVHFGATARGGGPGIGLLIGSRIDEEGLRRDWVIVHELTHLLHPHLSFRDAWFYEGLATYYGAVLRSRAGLITPDEAWAELHDGFLRGRASLAGGTLREDSRLMRKTSRYWRVYWSGAAILLLTDLRLREESAGSRSLDTLLAALWESCRQDPWSRPLQERLSRLEPDLAAPLRATMERHLDDEGFPDLSAAYEALGVDPGTGRLGPEAPGRRLLLPGPDSVGQQDRR